MKGMHASHASVRIFSPNIHAPRWYFRSQVFDTNGFGWSRSKLGILLIPRLPDVKPPCLTRRALGPGVFFCLPEVV